MTDASYYPGTPRWVKVFGLIALALVLLIATMMLTGGGPGGDHGPGRHVPGASSPGSQTLPTSVTRVGDAGVHTPPVPHP